MNNSTENYYTDTSRISNSNIGWFIKYGPAYLHKMLTDPKQEETAAMKKGTMIHMYLLQPEEFANTYEEINFNIPKSTQQKKFCESLINSVEIEPNKALLNAYKDAYSTVNQSEDLMLSKAKEIASTFKSYIDYNRNPEHKIKISKYDTIMLENIRDNIIAHKLAKELLNPSTGETYHEFHINWEYCDVQCKSLLDSINFDWDKKICTIVDLKTTVHIGCFEESIVQYDYFRQICFYKQAAIYYINEKFNNISEHLVWKFKYYIVAIDTVDNNEIRVFQLTDKQVDEKIKEISDTLNEIHWHQINNKWDHHKAYYEGDGSEILNL